MSANPGDGSIFYLGSRCFRSRRTIWKALAWVAVSMVAFALVAVGSDRRFPLSAHLLWIPLMGGAAALALAAGHLTAFAIAQVDHVVVSNRGVKCGGQSWDWRSVRAFRARRTGASGGIRLFIWTKEDKGPGRFLPMDEPLTPERALVLIQRVGDFCSTNHFNVTCEALCEDVPQEGAFHRNSPP